MLILFALALLATTACSHTAPKETALAGANAPATVPPATAPVVPTVPAVQPAPTVTAAASKEVAEPVPPACILTPNEIGQIHQLAKTRHYLRQQAFPQWEAGWPHFFVYNEHCQYVLNFNDFPGGGFKLSSQRLEMGGFGSPLVFYRENAVTLPTGNKLPFIMPAQASSSSGGENWFVLGLPDVWRRDYGDSLQTYLGMASRELFRSYQARIPGIRSLGDAGAREAFARFCRQNPEFARMVDEERSLLMRAITESDPAKKREWTKVYLDNEEKRRAKYFVGERASWRRDEPWLEAVDGSAEYMNFRVLSDCPDIPKDTRLTDNAGKAFTGCSRVPLAEALRQVAFRPSYLQDLGVLQIILLQQVVPRWQDSLFHGENAVESLLSTYTGFDPRVSR